MSRGEDTEKSIDTQTQRRGVSPQLGDTSSKGNCSPQLIDVSEEQLISMGANQNESITEENINNTIATGSCVVEFKKSDGSKPLTA